MSLNYKQNIALKYYRAYGALCFSNLEDINDRDSEALRVLREVMFMKYKQYDPDNSFDVSLDYDKQ